MVDLQRGPADPVAQEHTVKNVKLNFDVLYEMTLRNQYFVPSKKSPFVTVDYLIKVKNKEVFCPRYE